MHMPHEMRRALGADHHLAAILALPAREIRQDRFVLGGREIGQPGTAPRGNQEIAVEGDRPLLCLPLRQPLQLGAIPFRRGRLNDEIDMLRAQPAQRRERVLERALAVAEVVVVGGSERID